VTAISVAGPQQERSRRTRTALLDAALDVLVERGYAATTTVEVARRAGVSRGAQLHHFPTKAELLTAAMSHLCERRVDEYRLTFATLDPSMPRLDAAIDLLWQMYQGPTFIAWAELWVAARTDPELRPLILEQNRRFVEQTRKIYWGIVGPQAAAGAEMLELGLDFAYALMDGTALNALNPDRTHRDSRELIDALKVVAATMYPTEQEHPA
jgi:AcrR family transcriptional regulator